MPPEKTTERIPIRDLVRYCLRLGLLGFGGPVALVGQMERELVGEKKWLTKEETREGIAARQSLPGRLAIQVGIWISYIRDGFWFNAPLLARLRDAACVWGGAASLPGATASATTPPSSSISPRSSAFRATPIRGLSSSHLAPAVRIRSRLSLAISFQSRSFIVETWCSRNAMSVRSDETG